MRNPVLDLRSERGDLHPYVLFAGIAIVIFTAFLGLSEVASVSAAQDQVTRALQASLRGAGRIQDFQAEGRVLPVARGYFEQLLAANLALQGDGRSGDTLLLRPIGRHPYITGQVHADFTVQSDADGDTLVGRVRVPLRLPFIGPMFRRAYGHDVTVCQALAVTPHDLYGGVVVESIAIPLYMRC